MSSIQGPPLNDSEGRSNLQFPVAMYTYDSEGRLTTLRDDRGLVLHTTSDEFGEITAERHGHIVESVDDDPGFLADCGPAWYFSGLDCDCLSYDLFVLVRSGVFGTGWQSLYAVQGGTLTPAADLTPANLPDGWFKLGSIELPVFPELVTPVQRLIVFYEGSGPAGWKTRSRQPPPCGTSCNASRG
jgi:hypothetical protein